tara:strand:- start:69 stop:467 length:399 start_codon:yes stop_codon:yes gene_type:complete
MKLFIILILSNIYIQTNAYADHFPENDREVLSKIKTKSSKKAIALADYLVSINAIKYSTYWCPASYKQNRILGKEAASKIIRIDCSENGSNNKRTQCKQRGVEFYPTWEINGELFDGVKSLDELAELSGYKF